MSEPTRTKSHSLTAPLPAHITNGTAGISEPENDYDEEPHPLQQATQLQAIRRGPRASPGPSPNIQGSQRSVPISEIPTATDVSSVPSSYRLRRQRPRWYDGISRFWKRHVSIVVEVETRRDHLALERTYLSYVRTSLALSMIGITTAQLFRLQHAPTPNPVFGFYVTGIPLAAIFEGAALVVLLVGAFRFWRQQNAIVRGKVYAGGWEIVLIMVLVILLAMVLFGLAVGIDIDKEDLN